LASNSRAAAVQSGPGKPLLNLGADKKASLCFYKPFRLYLVAAALASREAARGDISVMVDSAPRLQVSRFPQKISGGAASSNPDIRDELVSRLGKACFLK